MIQPLRVANNLARPCQPISLCEPHRPGATRGTVRWGRRLMGLQRDHPGARYTGVYVVDVFKHVAPEGVPETGAFGWLWVSEREWAWGKEDGVLTPDVRVVLGRPFGETKMRRDMDHETFEILLVAAVLAAVLVDGLLEVVKNVEINVLKNPVPTFPTVLELSDCSLSRA